MPIERSSLVIKSHLKHFLLFFLLAIVCPANAQVTISPEDISDRLSRVDTYVESARQELNIRGLSIGIVSKNHVIQAKGFGVADEAGNTVTEESQFVIASLTKSFTALAVMQLVDQQLIDLYP